MKIPLKRQLIDALWRAKIHVEPRCLELAPPKVQAIFPSVWAPAQWMRQKLAAFPTGLLALWEGCPRGHLVFTHTPSRYQPGLQRWSRQELDGICFVSVQDLALNPLAAWCAVANLFDHLMGSLGEPEGPWLADGAGLTEPLRQVAKRFARIHALGYGHDALGAITPRDYLARTWALYLTDPRRLNVLDPQAFKLYRHTLMDEHFWNPFLPSIP